MFSMELYRNSNRYFNYSTYISNCTNFYSKFLNKPLRKWKLFGLKTKVRSPSVLNCFRDVHIHFILSFEINIWKSKNNLVSKERWKSQCSDRFHICSPCNFINMNRHKHLHLNLYKFLFKVLIQIIEEVKTVRYQSKR